MASRYVPLVTLLLPFAVFGLAGCGSTTRANPAPAAAPVSAALTVTSISPATVPAGSADLTLTITGTGFTAASVVKLSGTSEPTTYTSATQLRAVIPAAQLAAGAALAVSVVDGANSSPAAQAPALLVNNPVPAVSGLSPASIPAGSPGFTLDIAGTGFVPASTVSLAGAPLAVTFVSATELRAVVPAGSIVAGAAVPIVVSSPTPGGGQSAPASLAVTAPQPAIRALTPSVVPVGSAATIAVAGSGFEANSVVLWNGTARPTMFQNAGALTVLLSAADLAAPGTAQIAVSNPGPGAAVSLLATLTISPHAGPSITNVTVAAMPQTGGCDRIQATITGTGFTQPGGVQLNGTALAPYAVQTISPTQMVAVLPSTGLNSLSFVVTDNNYPPLASPAYAYPASAPPVFSVCPAPNPATVYRGTGFLATVQSTRINVASSATVSLGSLPAGITLQTPLPAAIPPAGAVLRFQASSSVAPGSYTIPIHGQAGSAGSDSSFAFTVMAGTPPAPQWIQPFYRETAVTIGSSVQQQFALLQSFPAADYAVTPSVSGLPPGVTASFDPQVVIPGGTTTLTLQAAANAPVTMNQTVTVIGTPDAPVPPATTSFLLEVTDAPGTRPDNGTDFTSTGGTPYGAVFDRAHHLVFASNPSWNRIDVLDTETHAIVKQLSVRDPRGIDITPDGSRIWVATASRRMVAIDPTTLAMRTVELPLYNPSSGPITAGNVTTGTWEGDKVFALADGTLMLYFSVNGGQTVDQPIVWDPAANTLTEVVTSFRSYVVPMARTGNGAEVYLNAADSASCNIAVYSTATRNVVSGPNLPEPCGFAAVNYDGTRVIYQSNWKYSLYDSSLHALADLGGSQGTYSSYAFLFSPDGATLYKRAAENGPPVFHTIDLATLTDHGTAPALNTSPVGVSGAQGLSTLLGVDSHGQLLGIQTFGIAFEDPTFVQHYAAQQPSAGPSEIPLAPDAGPIAGGTRSNIYGGFSLTPDAWYGGNRGTAESEANTDNLFITSPASSAPGPVNVKLLFPDGNQMFFPQGFSYGPYPQYAILSGSGPDGGVPGEVSGYGMPVDASGGTVTVGGGSAPITTKKTQYLPYTGEPFPSTFLQYTVPPGTPGWADVQVTTPDGTGTLPKGHFYAQSVTDYPSGDSFAAVLYDNKREQVYLSAGDHIDVFSVRSRQFLAPLHPAAQGVARLFTGLALTPDGSFLLAADLLDGSLAVIDPDSPANTYVVPIAPANTSNAACKNGPLYVAPTANNLVFITTGGLPAPACPAEGLTYVASLETRTAVRAPAKACGIGYLSSPFSDGFSVDSPADGSFVAIGSSNYAGACIYQTAQNSFALALGGWQHGLGVSVAGDGNVLASATTFADSLGNLVGRIAYPVVYFGVNYLPTYAAPNIPQDSLLRPRLNASGSLYFWAYPHFFDILDVAHGTLRTRFSLAETIQNTAAPLAVDAGGRQVFLITDKGLTIVDLGTAPLSIGHVGQLAGTQLTIRGSGFNAGTTATVGGEAAGVSFTDDSTLTLTLPSLRSGPQDITLTNPDGPVYTLQSAVTIP